MCVIILRQSNGLYFPKCIITKSSRPFILGPRFEDIDGVNQWNAIIGASKSARSEFLVNYDQKFANAAIRVGKWKLFQGKIASSVFIENLYEHFYIMQKEAPPQSLVLRA